MESGEYWRGGGGVIEDVAAYGGAKLIPSPTTTRRPGPLFEGDELAAPSFQVLNKRRQ